LTKEEADELLTEVYPALLKEYHFFIKERGTLACQALETSDCNTLVFHYDSASDYPRPESYMEDVELASEETEMLRNIASACESGWDFSSRWFENPYDMHTIRTTDILPVDLNTLMALNARDLAAFSKALGYRYTLIFKAFNH
jgi:alpha,alpha-trehalase